MKKINLICLLVIFVFCSYSVRSQCCCSFVQFTLVDEKGDLLEHSEIEIKEINHRLKINEINEVNENDDTFIPSGRVSFRDGENNQPFVRYRIGCGYGDEVLSIIYKGSEMKIHFRFKGEFGSVSGKITYQEGDFIAEPEEINDVGTATGIEVRKATDEEFK